MHNPRELRHVNIWFVIATDKFLNNKAAETNVICNNRNTFFQQRCLTNTQPKGSLAQSHAVHILLSP